MAKVTCLRLKILWHKSLFQLKKLFFNRKLDFISDESNVSEMPVVYRELLISQLIETLQPLTEDNQLSDKDVAGILIFGNNLLNQAINSFNQEQFREYILNSTYYQLKKEVNGSLTLQSL